MRRMVLPNVSEVGTIGSWREQPQLFSRGAIMAKRLSNKTLSEIKKIKASNDAYYKALSARDMRAMEKVWTCAADNMLIASPHGAELCVADARGVLQDRSKYYFQIVGRF